MKTLLAAALAACTLAAPVARAVDVEPYIRNDKFTGISISPTGEYYVAVVPTDDRSALAMIRRSDNAVVGHFSLGKGTYVDDFKWVGPRRILISSSEKMGALDNPLANGNLYAVDVDGKNLEILVGQGVAITMNTHIVPKPAERVAASLVDDLRMDDQYAIISVTPFMEDAFSRAERIDVYSGRRLPLMSAPIRNAAFATDNQGRIRFAYGLGTDNTWKLYYRKGDDWSLVNNQAASGHSERPIGFADDDRTAYLEVSQASGPDRIVAYDVESGARHDVLSHPRVDPLSFIYRPGTRVPVGAYFADVKREARFFDPASPQARLYKGLESAFGDANVAVESTTGDGKTAVVHVWSDRNPGDYYLVDTTTKKADYLLSSRDWFDPEKMAPVEAVDIPARDGTPLRGLVTYPAGKPHSGLPMVVLPHGGPSQVRDFWAFDYETQLLAAAGYAVLQVNFRGSDGYGQAFAEAGARQWGGLMQDDVTDATRWAVAKGIADPTKVCIYGASYGAYAALMGVAKEPDIYRCAAGYAGVYELPLLYRLGGARQSQYGTAYLKQWIGPSESLGAVSPTNLAGRVKAPVFLAAGGQDWTAPVEHTKSMESALQKAGVPVETLYYRTEGHGFFEMEHRREFYTRLLAFLARNLGGDTATTGGTSTSSK